MVNKGDVVYYAHILPPTFDVCELIVRTVDDGWFCGVDKDDGVAYLFNDGDDCVFVDREDALQMARIAEDEYKENVE